MDEKLKLKIETVSNLPRTAPPGQNTAPFTHPDFLKAIYTDDVLKNKHNTEAIKVGPSAMIAGRVVEYKPASKRPLAEVEALIRQPVTNAETARLAKQDGAHQFLHGLSQNLYREIEEMILEGDPVTAREINGIAELARDLRDQISN